MAAEEAEGRLGFGRGSSDLAAGLAHARSLAWIVVPRLQDLVWEVFAVSCLFLCFPLLFVLF